MYVHTYVSMYVYVNYMNAYRYFTCIALLFLKQILSDYINKVHMSISNLKPIIWRGSKL